VPISGGWQIHEYQLELTLDQATPVQNTWYPVVSVEVPTGVMSNALMYGIGAGVEDTNETIQFRITVDGQTITSSAFPATHSTNYYAFIDHRAINQDVAGYFSTNATSGVQSPYLLNGKSILVELRKTTATGTGNLVGIVTWGQLTNA